MESAGEQSIKSVTHSSQHKQAQRQQIVAIDQPDQDEGQEQHAEHRELVWCSEQLRDLHARSCVASRLVSKLAGSSPVFAVKRCEREGMLPSGRSSSMRSSRCMGKNTTPREKASPSLTRATRSSNDASSMPRKLKPSALNARIAPQNFSRGFESVTTTIVPGLNGLAPSDTGRRASRLGMPEILAAMKAECNLSTPACQLPKPIFSRYDSW